jgi:ATP-dependent DNA ligase
MKVYDYVNRKYGVTEYWVDGELFTTAVSFNTLNGILKKQTLAPGDQQVLDSLEYHVYDIILDAPYETRYKVTQYFDCGCVKRVLAYPIVATTEALEEKFLEYIAAGHEGMMIRQLGMPYENKRTWQLLKFKAFEDDEFPIVGFEESRSGDTLGAIVFQMPCGTTFKAATTGFTLAEQKQIWDNQTKYLGKKMTVEYFGFSPKSEGGRPRFPKVKGQRADLV